MTPPLWLLLAIAVVLLASAAAWAWANFKPAPSHDREWAPDQSVAPHFLVDGSLVTVQGVRNFRWLDAERFEPAWEERTYDLAELERVWLVLTPFSRLWRGPAHALLSFQFGSDFLAISVEARREIGETYGVIKGMLRRFELVYVAGLERDLVGYRAVQRGDRVHVYPARVPVAGARRLFLEIAASANRLREKPEFYHSITNNCATRIVKHVNGVVPRSIPRSWRVLLPGYADALAFELGVLDTTLPLEQARRRWLVNDRARRWFDAPDFSQRIRAEE